MGNYPPAYLYRKISQVSSFVSSMGALRAPIPPSIGEEEQTHNPVEVKDVVEEVQEIVEEVTHGVEEVKEIVEEVVEVVEEQKEENDTSRVEVPIVEVPIVEVQHVDVPHVEVPQASLTVALESFMPPAFHFPTSPFSMSVSQPNRLRHRKRRG